jgi:hypothetical protein
LTFSVKISILEVWGGFVERNYLASLPKGPNFSIRPLLPIQIGRQIDPKSRFCSSAIIPFTPLRQGKQEQVSPGGVEISEDNH